MFKASSSVRLFLLMLAGMLMIGIGLTGFDQVHWFSYVVPAFLVLASVTGLCPGLLVSKKLLGLAGIKE